MSRRNHHSSYFTTSHEWYRIIDAEMQAWMEDKTASDVTPVYWYVNNKFYKSSPAGNKQFFIPDEGPVKISATGDKGRNRDTWIKVTLVRL